MSHLHQLVTVAVLGILNARADGLYWYAAAGRARGALAVKRLALPSDRHAVPNVPTPSTDGGAYAAR